MSSSSESRRSAEYAEEPVTQRRLWELWSNLWDRGYEELARLQLTPEMSFALALQNAQRGPAKILTADGVPVCAAGVSPDASGALSTWFQASKAFDEHAMEVTKFLRREIRARGAMFIYSTCVHPETARWFRVLGFAPDGWTGKTTTGFAITRFARIDKHVL